MASVRTTLDLKSTGIDGPLNLRYVAVSLAISRRWERNFRVHDLPKIKESIRRQGFRNPAIFDDTLNEGEGGIAAGNGRVQALSEMKAAGEPAPDYIIEQQGEWYFPVIFGVASETLAQAEAYAIDDNNTGMSVLPADEVKKIWGEGYLQVLQDLQAEDQLPVTVRPEQLQKWIDASQPKEPQDADPEMTAEKLLNSRPSMARFAIKSEDIPTLESAIAATGKQHDRSLALKEICEFYLSVHG